MHKRSKHEPTHVPKTQNRSWIVVPALLAAVTAGCGTLLAQREPESSSATGKTSRLAQAPASPSAVNTQANVNSKDLKEREAKFQQQRETALRDFMISRGFTDKDVQNAIIAHLQKQEQARRELVQGGQRLLPLLHGEAQSIEEKTKMQAAVETYGKALDALPGTEAKS